MNAPFSPSNGNPVSADTLFDLTGSPELPPRPTFTPFTGLPALPAIDCLRTRRQFVPWTYILAGGETSKRTGEIKPFKWVKKPLDVRTGLGASVADAESWTDYETATAYAVEHECAGVGYVLVADDGIAGGDLDKVRDPVTGSLVDWAAALIKRAETYCEISPSGRGVRIFGLGKPAKAAAFVSANAEVYGTGRWLSLTGRHIAGTPTDIRPAPETFRSMEERIARFRAEARAAIETEREANGKGALQARSRAEGETPTFWQAVDAVAMVNFDRWVPDLFLGLAKRAPGGGYRVTSEALGRDLEEDIGIHETGIRDWGVADMGDHREGKRTPIGLVKEWLFEFGHVVDQDVKAKDAAFWLCERLDLSPDSLGWNTRKTGEGYFEAHVAGGETDENSKPAEGLKPDTTNPKKERKKREYERRNPDDKRPVITVRAGDIEAVVNQMEDALVLKGGFFQRAGEIVSIGEMPIVTAGEQEATALRVIPKGKHAVAEAISSAACMMKFDARAGDMVVVNPPMHLVETLMDRAGRFRLSPLAGVVTAPTLRPDGTVLDMPGYDKATGLFFEPGKEHFPTISPRPSRADAEAGLAAINEIIRHFPFVSEADRTVALSAIITACVRQAIPTVPLHAFTAPVRGSGKSMLADIASVIATGRPAAVMAQAGDEVEAEKRLTGMLLQGAPIIALDNCTAPIDGAFLNAIVTQTVATVRPLGSSRMVDVPSNTFLMAGGNSLVVNGDMTRRTIMCSLDPRMERPETRRFDFNPVQRAKAQRCKLVAAVLTILLAHRAAGSPTCGEPLGSFERWSRVVRDALIWMGRPDPLLTMEALQGEDPEKAELDAVLTRWAEKIGPEQRITVAQLIDRVAAYDHAPFRLELLNIAGAGGVINGRKLGKWLNRHAKRRSNGRWIEHAGILSGNMTWRLREG